MKKLKRKNNLVKKIAIISTIVMVGYFLLYYFNFIVNPMIFSISEGEIRSQTTKAVNNAVAEVVSNYNLYDTLVNVVTDENGNVSFIYANAIEINNLTKELIKVSQNRLDKLGLDSIKIPLGNFTGIPLLSGIGKKIKIKVLPLGSMSCNFISQFVQAGINQTNHKIYVNFESYVNVVMPIESRIVTTNNQILVCECIIVGKVPEVYLGTQGDDILNLLPQ